MTIKTVTEPVAWSIDQAQSLMTDAITASNPAKTAPTQRGREVSRIEQPDVAGNGSLARQWSAALIADTRATFEHPEPFADGYVHLKKGGGIYGRIAVQDLVARRFLIQDKATLEIARFLTIDAILLAHWVID